MGENRPQPDPDRLTRLEEAVGFIDHTANQLSGEIAALNREVAHLTRRLESLERRLGELHDAVVDAPPVVPPPHSAGPDVPRDPL
ncbi:MAG: SlyX family protein [Phycisphaerales bacterium]|nr:SlyX family protein [Planctomycetota bacterium]MCH8509814.1 SlyX family protein [Phycisphaerales bacterium]